MSKYATSEHEYRGVRCEDLRAAVIRSWRCLDDDGEERCYHCGRVQSPEFGDYEHEPGCIVLRLHGGI